MHDLKSVCRFALMPKDPKSTSSSDVSLVNESVFLLWFSKQRRDNGFNKKLAVKTKIINFSSYLYFMLSTRLKFLK
jgi:hypothetical protein